MRSFSQLLLFIALFLVSCNKDPLLSEEIIGTYSFVSIEISGCDDMDSNIAPITPDSNGCFEIFTITLCDVSLTFSADGTLTTSGTRNGNPSTDSEIYTVNDETREITVSSSGPGVITNSNQGSFTLNGNELIFTETDPSGCTDMTVYIKQ